MNQIQFLLFCQYSILHKRFNHTRYLYYLYQAGTFPAFCGKLFEYTLETRYNIEKGEIRMNEIERKCTVIWMMWVKDCVRFWIM